MGVVCPGHAYAYIDPDTHLSEVDFAPDFQVDGLYYKIISGGVELTRAEGSWETAQQYQKVTVTVPASVTYNGETYPVIRIGEAVFQKNKTLKKIILPEGLKSIGKCAFYQSSIENFNFPTTLETIGQYAFCYCQGLKSIVIPDNVANLTIDGGAFSACSFMEEFTIGRGVRHMALGALGAITWTEPGLSGGLNKYCASTELRRLYCPFDNPPSFEPLVGNWYEWFNPLKPNGDDFYAGRHYYLFHHCILYVPVGSREKYKKHDSWKAFEMIREDKNLSAIDDIAVDGEGIRVEGGRIMGEGVMEVYDLGGRQVARGVADELPELPAGFYIVRNQTSTAKIAIR